MGVDQAALAALWKELPVGICVYDGEGRPLSHNEAFARITGSAPTVQSPLAEPLARALTGETVSGLQAEWPTDAGPQHVQVLEDRGEVPAVEHGGWRRALQN